MGSFLKPKTKISVELPCSPLQAEQVAADLQIVVSKLNPSEITLLAKALSKPLIKTAALAKLKTML